MENQEPPPQNDALHAQNQVLAQAQITQLKRDLERWSIKCGTCDGVDRTLLRSWIDNVQDTKAWTRTPDSIFVPWVISLTRNPLTYMVNQ